MVDYLSERVKMISMTKLKVLAVPKHGTDDGTDTPPWTTFGQLMEFFDIIAGISQNTKKDSLIFGR